MAEGKTTGLIIGKFAPLHRGHRFLIESALKKCDRLIVLVYDVPELTAVPVAVRMGWIKRLYPEIEVLNAGVGPRDAGDTSEVNRKHSDYVKRQLPPGGKIDSVFSSEDYGRPLAEALGSENVVVDRQRTSVPISAGLIREDLEGFRQYVEDFVYEDLVRYEINKKI